MSSGSGRRQTLKRNLLREWCKQQKGRQKWIADKMCCDYTTIHDWCKDGVRHMTLENAFLIERFTEGQVPAASWLDDERIKAIINGRKP